MRKLILASSILLFLFSFSSILKAEDSFESITPVTIDEEHVKLFNDLVPKFLENNFVTQKEFQDGDILAQKITDVILIRIDLLGSGVERYITNLKIDVKRFEGENATYKEEHLLQIVFFDIKDGKIVDFHPFETIDITEQFKSGV